MSKTIMRINQISKEYNHTEVLSGISFRTHPGDIIGLIGENGSGKTTLLSIIAGIRKPTSGVVKICGKTLELDEHQYYTDLGIALDSMPFYMNLNARDNILMVTTDKSAVDTVIETVGLSYAANRPVSKYSLGMKQRLNIARSMVNSPRQLIMDEPINGLDPKAVFEFKNYIQRYIEENNASLLISSHALKEMLNFCNRYIFIKSGNIYANINCKKVKVGVIDSYCIVEGDNVEDFLSNHHLEKSRSIYISQSKRLYLSSIDCPDVSLPLQPGQTFLDDIYMSM